MSLLNIQPWVLRAQREHFAIGAFNANTLEQVQAIVEAAQAEAAPVIIQVSHRALQYIGCGNETVSLRYIAEIGRVAAQSVSVPVSLHLDHANEAEVLQAIGLGFTSVMFDGGNLPFEENIEATRKLCERAHASGVNMEAELGEVPKPGNREETRLLQEAGFLGQTASNLTPPDQAAEFIRAAGIDALAIAIGSVHAVKQKTVELDLERLKAIRAVVDIPLVLHGSSGVTDECIAAGIALGLCKVNVATQLNQAFTGAVRAKLSADAKEVDPRQYLSLARNEMTERVRERMRLLGAAGKVER